MSTKKSGFTLVEILIVVVILGILAAIVIPQFTSASTEASEANLVSNLQAVRSQIELYKIQHNDQLPGNVAGVTFTQALTERTDKAGELWVDGTSIGNPCGKYMQKIPKNPFTGSVAVTTGATALGAGVADAGWHFVTSGEDAGLFQASDDGVNPLDDDTPHIDY